MSDDLNLLRISLTSTFASGPRAPDTWSDPTGMRRTREKVQRDHGGAGIVADAQSILSSIAAFRRAGTVEVFRDLKYVCLGVGAVDGTGWCVLGDLALRGKVADLVSGQREQFRRFRCFQALLSSYWTFPKNRSTTNVDAVQGWKELRAWLRAEYEKHLDSSASKPMWFDSLSKYVELLSNLPCEKFGAALLVGDASGLKDAMESLSIPTDSWVMEEAVFSQMKAAADLPDDAFKRSLEKLVPLSIGLGGMKIEEPLRQRCVAHLVSRYAQCADRPEQPALRDAAISTIGNPWLHRTAWDARVVDSRGRPHDQAREMINGWLKRRLITDFFEMLSVDGRADRRRLDYWLRFEPFIGDMWFALGSYAQYRKGEQFDDFRSRAKGRILELEGTSADNNAFAMRIGEHVAIEFGATGNAFYLFKWDDLGAPLLNALTSGRPRARVPISRLKAANHVHWQRHMDSPVALKSWEQKFDDNLCQLMGKRPAKRPACLPGLEAILARASVDANDMRAAGGALWILADDHNVALSRELRTLGFRYRQGKGWSRE